MAPKRKTNKASTQRAKKNNTRVARSLTSNQKKEVKILVKGEAESKRATFFQSYNDGTSTQRATGAFNVRGFARQNNVISNNNTDILQIIPEVAEGTDYYQRIGNRISPKSLIVRGSIRLQQVWNVPPESTYTPPINVDVYIYVLQHVMHKDYQSLYNLNNFNELLDVGNGQCVKFDGSYQISKLPVAKQYYRLLQKKKITLRYGGVMNAGGSTTLTTLSVANAHAWSSDFVLNLTKHLPKVLKYPVTADTTQPQDEPTNSSLFWCMGYVDWFQANTSGANPPVVATLQQTYVSDMTFKDL